MAVLSEPARCAPVNTDFLGQFAAATRAPYGHNRGICESADVHSVFSKEGHHGRQDLPAQQQAYQLPTRAERRHVLH